MTNDEIDYAADAELDRNDNLKGVLTGAVQEYMALEQKLESLDGESKVAKERLNEFKMRRFPELLEAYGGTSFTDATTGAVVSLELLVAGSLPKDEARRAESIAYVESLGGGDLVKTKVVIEFGRGEEVEASNLVAKLKESAFPFNVTVTKDIHAQTLAAFARERIRDGKEIDCAKAGLYMANIAVPKIPKTKVVKVKARL